MHLEQPIGRMGIVQRQGFIVVFGFPHKGVRERKLGVGCTDNMYFVLLALKSTRSSESSRAVVAPLISTTTSIIMRQSLPVANRTSHLALPQSNSAAAAAKLLEKKKEFDAVSALERASTLYLERIEGFSDDCDVMADAGQGKVIYRMNREHYV